MGSLLKSTFNTRAILPDSLLFVRSDVPWQLSDEETRWLLAQNITTIMDLRTPEERLRKPCPLAKDSRFRCYEMPVTGGSEIPPSVKDVSGSYIRMVDTQMEKIIDLIWNAPSNVLYFCNAGKDRTGVVCAILLGLCGVAENDIVYDYMMTKTYNKERFELIHKNFPEIDMRIVIPSERYMTGFIDQLKSKYGSFREYLIAIGVTADEIESILAKLL